MLIRKKIPGFPNPMPSPPPDNRVATQVPIFVRRPLIPTMGSRLKLLSGVTRPIPVKFM